MPSASSFNSDRNLFADRRDAGRRLAQALVRYRTQRPLVLALPRGGVPVGLEIARALAAPLDIVLVRKLRAPGYPELGIGAVVDAAAAGSAPHRVLNRRIIDDLGVSAEYLEAETQAQLQIIEQRRHVYRGDVLPPPIAGCTVILTDDGVATGGSARAALQALASAGAARRVLAVPVGPRATLQELAAECDELVVLHTPDDFRAVGFYYADFTQLSDTDVVDLLQRQQPGGQQNPEGIA